MSHELITALDEAWSAITTLLAEVEGDDWHRPTPCTEWDVHDLAAHLGAIEGAFQGLPQPEAPPPPTDGLDAWTAVGVTARREWTPDQIRGEIAEASSAQLSTLKALDEDGWSEQVMGPLGPMPRRGVAEIRLFDIYVHLLDLRVALDRPLDPDAQPTACRVAVDRAVALTGWGAVKKAGLPDGARVRLDLSGPGGVRVDVVVADGRGAMVEPEGDADDVVSGAGSAYLLVAAGRDEVARAAGGVDATGDDARRLVEGYRMFA